jgi:hypothetical protein
MKRKAHYNVSKGAGGGKYTDNIPDRRRNARLRPVQAKGPGASRAEVIIAIGIVALGLCSTIWILSLIL